MFLYTKRGERDHDNYRIPSPVGTLSWLNFKKFEFFDPDFPRFLFGALPKETSIHYTVNRRNCGVGETKGGSFVLSVINLLAEWLYKCNIRGSNLDREKETDRPYSFNSLLDQRLVGWESFNGKWAMLWSVTGRPKSRARRKLHSPTNVVKCCQKLPRSFCGTNRQRNEWKKHNYCE